MSFYKRENKNYSGFWIFKKFRGVSNMAKKVYCSKCESIDGAKGMFGSVSTINCVNDNNKKEIIENTNLDWFEEPKAYFVYDKKPAEINKSNNCPWFSAKKEEV